MRCRLAGGDQSTNHPAAAVALQNAIIHLIRHRRCVFGWLLLLPSPTSRSVVSRKSFMLNSSISPQPPASSNGKGAGSLTRNRRFWLECEMEFYIYKHPLTRILLLFVSNAARALKGIGFPIVRIPTKGFTLSV